MSQPILNSSFSGISIAGMNRGSRLSYTSLRAASGDNSINEEERLSTRSAQAGSSRGSLPLDHPRLSQPDVRRFILRHDVPAKRERLSQPTLVTGDYHPGQQRLSQPCLSSGKEIGTLPMMVFHSPSPPPLKHKRFSPAIHTSQRDRLSQLDIGAKYRNFKESTTTKFNRDRFSIPELETQNDLRLIAGTPKQRFSLDSQLTRNQDTARSRLLPIASSPVTEHQKIDELTCKIPGAKLKSPTCEGLGRVLITSTTPILPPGIERQQLLSPEIGLAKKGPPPLTNVAPVPNRERMSVPEIRNSSLRRLLDPPARQRHSITGSVRQTGITSPIRPFELASKKLPKFLFEEALERFKKDERQENRKNEMSNVTSTCEPKHIQKHYSYTYESSDDTGSSILGKLSAPVVPKKKYLESNFDENEQVITTVIETDVPMIVSASPKYVKRNSTYSSETPKWIRRYLDNESPKGGRKTIAYKEKAARKNSRRKSSLESDEFENIVTAKSMNSEEKTPMLKSTGIQIDANNMKNTYVRIVPSNNTQENKYEVGIESNWTDAPAATDTNEPYGDDTDSDDSTSV